MTSVKCFSNWFKDAGRGHLSAFLSWGILIIYGITMLTRLSFDTDFTYFGIGSMELVWICAGLGILLAFFEFFYLLQSRKQDLYYSLPVSKSMIFWSRYVHGLVHFLAPLILVLVVCGIYEGSLDIQFLKVSVSYTGKSILTAAAYISDRSSMKMEDLSDVHPLGFLQIASGEQNQSWEMPVYPFFEQTCRLLEKYGVQTEKGIQDYPVISVEMYESYAVPANTSGGVSWKYYDTPEDIAQWQPRLVPAIFDLQPLLCPLDYKEVRAVVEDTETNSTMEIDCVMKTVE